MIGVRAGSMARVASGAAAGQKVLRAAHSLASSGNGLPNLGGQVGRAVGQTVPAHVPARGEHAGRVVGQMRVAQSIGGLALVFWACPAPKSETTAVTVPSSGSNGVSGSCRLAARRSSERLGRYFPDPAFQLIGQGRGPFGQLALAAGSEEVGGGNERIGG